MQNNITLANGWRVAFFTRPRQLAFVQRETQYALYTRTTRSFNVPRMRGLFITRAEIPRFGLNHWKTRPRPVPRA